MVNATRFGDASFRDLEFVCGSCCHVHWICFTKLNFVIEVDEHELNIYTPICPMCGEIEVLLYKNITLADLGIWGDRSASGRIVGMVGICFDSSGG